MTEQRDGNSLVVGPGQPLIGIPLEENGRSVVRYFGGEDEADAAASQDTLRAALSLAGAWADMDWEESQEELHRIRHQSNPTPPITMKRYLLATGPLEAYPFARPTAVELIRPWILQRHVATGDTDFQRVPGLSVEILTRFS